MAEGLSSTQANAYLNSLCRAAAYTAPTAVWIKLHVGAPGAAGTSNPATETTRKQGTFGTIAAGGSIANTAASQWTSVAGTEDYTHFTAWDASTSGNFLFSGLVTANAVVAGDTFTAPIGSLTVSLPIAS